jgi:hypothetical protein
MKKICFTIITVCLSLNISFAGDILTLLDKETRSAGISFSGEITKIKNCEIVFKMEGKKYFIPASDIYCIDFEDVNNKVLKGYKQLSGSEKCMYGMNDAEMYHKSGLSFAMGVLFGPFAVIGAAISNPSPLSGQNLYLSSNKEFFNDPTYLACYSKSARKKNLKNAALGWLSWVVLILVLSSGAQ